MKRYALIFLVIALLAAIYFVPAVRNIFVPVAAVEEHLHFTEQDLNVQLKGINVPDTTLRELAETKPLFLNFWGSWCAPCVKEWPSIQKLYDRDGKRVNFALVAMLEDEAKIKKFLAENGYTAPVYVAASPLSDAILPKVFPTTYLLDAKKRILLKETSSKDWYTDSQTKILIDNLTKP